MLDDVKDVGDTKPAKSGGSGIQNTGEALKGGKMEKQKCQGDGKKGSTQQQVTAMIYHCVLVTNQILLKPSMCDRLDQGEGYTSCIRGFTSIEIRL